MTINVLFFTIDEILDKVDDIRKSIMSRDNNIFLEKMTDKSPKGYWKCTICGRSNPNYTGTCACGKAKE